MAPKRAYTAERLHAIAARAAEKAQGDFAGCDIECKYQGDDGGLPKRGKAPFQWKVRVECLNADRRGVRFPESWRTAIPSAQLHDVAQKTAAETESGVVSLSCAMLGLPKIAPLPSAGARLVPGAVVQLQTRSLARQDYLLAAHIDGDRRCAHCALRSGVSVF